MPFYHRVEKENVRKLRCETLHLRRNADSLLDPKTLVHETLARHFMHNRFNFRSQPEKIRLLFPVVREPFELCRYDITPRYCNARISKHKNKDSNVYSTSIHRWSTERR